MDDAVKHLARLLRSRAITPQTYAEGLSALAEIPPTPVPRQRREPSTPAPRQRREPPTLPRATCRQPTRLGRTPTSRICPTRGPSRPHDGKGLSRPRVSWCSAGLAGSSAHSYEAGRWMCLKGTPMVQTPGLS